MESEVVAGSKFSGVVQKSLAGGSMLRDGLAGRTVKLVLREILKKTS